MQIRKIIHIDMDAFYAAVEQRDNPKLRGQPIIIGGTPEQRSVVSTASYEARKYGVKSAMSVAKALKLCPHLIIVRGDMQKYSEISHEVYKIYKEYTDVIEPVALDECYLDVTINKKNISSAAQIAKEIRESIRSKLRLTASAGVSVNKLIAKIASDYNKPDGLCVVPPDKVEAFMSHLEVKRINGVGKAAQKILNNLKVKYCCDLYKYSIIDLIRFFGIFGESLYYYIRGIDNRPVVSHRERKSIGSERTFSTDLTNTHMITKKLYKELETVVSTLKRKSFKCKTITLKVKYKDFVTITRSHTIDFYTDDFLIIYNIILDLLQKTEVGIKEVRLIGASVSNFEKTYGQLELPFDN